MISVLEQRLTQYGRPRVWVCARWGRQLFKHAPYSLLVSDCLTNSRHSDFFESCDPAETLHVLARLPMARVVTLELTFRRLGFLCIGGLHEQSEQLAGVSDQWVQTAEATKIASLDAEATAKIWEEYPAAKKQFAKPGRRVIKHSKAEPLTTKGLLNAGTCLIRYPHAVIRIPCA